MIFNHGQMIMFTKDLYFFSDDNASVAIYKNIMSAGLCDRTIAVFPDRYFAKNFNIPECVMLENDFVRLVLMHEASREFYFQDFHHELVYFRHFLERYAFSGTISMHVEMVFSSALSFAISYIKNNNIRRMVFLNIPHQPHTYIFKVAAKFLNLDFYERLTPPFGNEKLHQWLLNSQNLPDENHNISRTKKEQHIKSSLKKILHSERVKDRFSYMAIHENNHLKGKFLSLLYNFPLFGALVWFVRALIKRKKILAIPMIECATGCSVYTNLFGARRIYIHRLLRIRKYKNEYKKHSLRKIDLTKHKYVYFPLHYQPEASTLPMAYPYHSQHTVLAKLSSNIPDEIKIFVKEHPTQFMSAYRGDRGRWHGYYEQISKLKNTYLINERIPADLLIENSLAVVTINGSTSLEALLRFRKPIGMFAQPTYYFPQIKMINEDDNLKEFLVSLMNRSPSDIDPSSIIDIFVDLEARKYYFDSFPTELLR